MENVAWKRLGWTSSRLGLGAWGIGGQGVGETSVIQGREVLRTYLEAGGNFIDTAPTYGESEELIGQTLAQWGGKAYVATKTKFGETRDTLSRIRPSLEDSLKRLGRDHVDLFYLHMPPEDPEVMEEALGICRDLRAEGKIVGIGASIKGPSVTEETVRLIRQYVDSGEVDVIQLVYSVLRQRNLEAIRYAHSRGVHIVVRTALESGFLTGKYKAGTRFAPDDHRSRWNPRMEEILALVEDLQHRYVKEEDIAALSIQFALKEQGVTALILGAKNQRQMERNLASCSLFPMSDTLYQALQAAYGGKTDLCNPA